MVFTSTATDLANNTKICPKCSETKNLDDFYVSKGRRGTGHASYCDTCAAKYTSEHKRSLTREQLDVVNASNRTWRRNNPRNMKSIYLRKSFGIDIDKYEEMFESQNGLCLICGQSKKLSVDHNHTTGKVRGLLCSTCNAGIGMLKDDIFLVEKALAYLKEKD